MGRDLRVRTILVGGHESADGADLVRLEAAIDGAQAAKPGRQLHDRVSDAVRAGDTVVVVPMTFGRNPTMVADAAKTLSWLERKHPGRLALAAPFGTTDHLTAWLRRTANTVRSEDPAAALVVAAPRSNPFDEADVHRIAYLVATHGAAREVFPAIEDPDEGVGPVIERLRRLGIDRSVVAPVGFAAVSDERFGEGALIGSRFFGPLMSDAAIARVVRTRVASALDDLAAGHDGIALGLDADHGHGYAHSHAFEDAGHAHSHGAAHSHSHSHTHADGTTHTHDHDGLHAHVHAP